VRDLLENQTNHLALVIDTSGVIKEIITSTNKDIVFRVGAHLIEYIQENSLKRFMSFLKDVLNEGYSFGGEIIFHQNGQYFHNRLSMLQYGEDIICMSLNESEETIRVLNEIIRMNNDQTNLIRRSYSLGEQVGEDPNTLFLEELTSLNNELVNMQRKVEQKNFELSRLNQKLIDISVTDYLTDIPNRRKFFEDIMVIAKEKPYCLVIVDIDNFKLANDVKGHLYGDKVLKEFATHLREYSKKFCGLVYRLGGDEFALLIPEEYQGLFESKVEELDRFLSRYEVNLSISYGIEALPYKEDNLQNRLEEAIASADKKMYGRKRLRKG
jgi:diguanylate cyclase (GGDEF)-like protein